MRRFMSRVGVCELREAIPPHLDDAGRVLYQPLTDADKALGEVLKKRKALKDAKIKSLKDKAKSALTAAVGIPAGAMAYMGGDIEESQKPIMRRVVESRVLDAIKSALASGKEIGKDLAGMAAGAVRGTVQAAHDLKHGRAKDAVKNVKNKIKRGVAGFTAKHPVITKELHDTGNYAGPLGLLTSQSSDPGNLREGENDVEMPRKEYAEEHRHLLKVLSKCKLAACKQEARKQKKEMRKELRKKAD